MGSPQVLDLFCSVCCQDTTPSSALDPNAPRAPLRTEPWAPAPSAGTGNRQQTPAPENGTFSTSCALVSGETSEQQSWHQPPQPAGPGKRIPLRITALPCQSLPSHRYFGTGSGSGAELTHPAAPKLHHPPEPSQEQRAVVSEPQSSRANTGKAPATERAITRARPCRSPGRTRQRQQQTPQTAAPAPPSRFFFLFF